MGLNGLSNVAGFIAGMIYRSDYAPSYVSSLRVTLIVTGAGAIGFLFIRCMYMLENRRRRRKITASGLSYNTVLQDELNSAEKRGDQRLTWVYGY